MKMDAAFLQKFNKEKNPVRFNGRLRVISIVSAIFFLTSPLSVYDVSARVIKKVPTTTTQTTPTTPTTTTPTTTTVPAGAIDVSAVYGLKSGKTLYYNSSTNRHYYDSSFTQTPQLVSDILNRAFLENKNKGVTIYVPAGDYLLDKPLLLQNGVTLEGVSGKTRFFADDTFNRMNDDFIISNADNAQVHIKNIYAEYKGGKTPVFSDYSVNPKGIEGILLKILKTPKAVVENSSFIVKNNGTKTTITPVWARNGFKNVDIHNCYIENTSGANVGGCLWFMNNNGEVGDTVTAYNNTIVKNGNDEAIAIWGNDGGVNQNYNIYNNTVNYTKGTQNTTCDKLIAILTWSNGLYKNIKFTGNKINITGNTRRIISTEIGQGTFSNVVFEKNIINDSTGDSTANTLLSVIEVWSDALPTDLTPEDMYLRGDVSFNYNSYTNTNAYGRRCFVNSHSALVKLTGNIVNSYFGYSVIFAEDNYSKIVSIGNDYNYSGTRSAKLAIIQGAQSNAYYSGDKIRTGAVALTGTSNIVYSNCIYA